MRVCKCKLSAYIKTTDLSFVCGVRAASPISPDRLIETLGVLA